jgi:hypothetical protein
VSEEQQVNQTSAEQPKILRVPAHIVSFICHPIFFPLVMAIVIYKLSPVTFISVPPKQVGLWFLNIGFTAVFIPLFSILLMKPLGFISSYHMPTAKERTIPLMSCMIFYFWLTHVFNSLGMPAQPGSVIEHVQTIPAPLIFKVLFLGNFWGIILVFLINIFTKISMHTSTAGAMIGILIVLMMTSDANMTIPLLAGIAIAGVIGTARMILGAHQKGDIWLGYIVGILVQLGAYMYMK